MPLEHGGVLHETCVQTCGRVEGYVGGSYRQNDGEEEGASRADEGEGVDTGVKVHGAVGDVAQEPVS